MGETRAESSSRVGGVIDAGYATARERRASDVLMMIMRGFERDRPLLLTIVCGGLTEWRRVARPQLRPHGVTDETIDAVFSRFVEWAGVNPAMQLLKLQGMQRIQDTTSWDHRQRTKTSLTEGMRAAMKELRQDQRRRS